jgi:hypothetical protein
MTLLNGVQQVANTLNKDSAVMMQANAVAQKAYSVAVGTSTGALKLFRLALIATGIGAAVVAVGALVANWDKLTEAVMKFVNSSPVLTKVIGFITDAFTRLGQAIGFIPSQTEAMTRQMIEDLEAQLKVLEAAGTDTFAIEKRLAELRIQLAKETGEGLAEAEQELVILTAQKEKEKLDIRTAAEQKAREERQKAIDAAREVDRKLLEDLNKHLNDTEMARFKAEQKRLENQEAFNIRTMQAEGKRRTDSAAQREKNAQQVLADEQFLADQRYQLTLGSFQAIADLSAFFAGKSEEGQERAFKIQKAVNIAKTLIETYAAAQSAYASQLTVPDPSAPIRAAIAAGVAIASGLARVAAIRNTNFSRASNGMTAGVRPAGMQGGVGGLPPQGFSPNQSTPIVPPQGQNGNGQLPPQRVFVLERDIQNVGRRVRNVESFATFG